MPELDAATAGWVAVGLDVLLVGATLLVILKRRKSVPATLAWIFAIVAFPFAGCLAWFLLAAVRVKRVARRRRLSAERVRRELAAVFGAREGECPAGSSVLLLASRLTGLPPTGGNRLRLLTDNAEAFAAKREAILSAAESVWAEYYVVKDDETGNGFLDLLVERARQGLDVRLLHDAVGSSRIDGRRLAALREAGGKEAAFLPVNPFRRRWSTHLRNHRKLLVLDRRTAFTGGMNVGNEYSGLALRRPRDGPWRDTHVRVDGPAAYELARVFVEDWTFQTGEGLLPSPPSGAPAADGSIVAVLPSEPAQPENASALSYFAGIASARERCYLTSPYFVPDEPTVRALVSAALRGVDVRLLVPERSDAPLVSLAAWWFFPPLLAAGVRVFAYRPAILHAKTMVVDGTVSLVGSANMDVRSFLHNFELGVLVHDAALGGELERLFLGDLASTEEVTLKSWYRKGIGFRRKAALARLLSPLL
ncbi:MAG: cardiolipin synthase [Acidobacteria bacterium]|nr:MAG: cardiolipin synthase [Acidobacteriota bacterium]MCE7958408.1 cardiolipin synthase [Acidobacteria bacterium ACB2]